LGAWDPAHALVALSKKDIHTKTGTQMNYAFVPWTKIRGPVPQCNQSKGKLCDVLLSVTANGSGGAARMVIASSLNDFFAKEDILADDFMRRRGLRLFEWTKNTRNIGAAGKGDAIG